MKLLLTAMLGHDPDITSHARLYPHFGCDSVQQENPSASQIHNLDAANCFPRFQQDLAMRPASKKRFQILASRFLAKFAKLPCVASENVGFGNEPLEGPGAQLESISPKSTCGSYATAENTANRVGR